MIKSIKPSLHLMGLLLLVSGLSIITAYVGIFLPLWPNTQLTFGFQVCFVCRLCTYRLLFCPLCKYFGPKLVILSD